MNKILKTIFLWMFTISAVVITLLLIVAFVIKEGWLSLPFILLIIGGLGYAITYITD